MRFCDIHEPLLLLHVEHVVPVVVGEDLHTASQMARIMNRIGPQEIQCRRMSSVFMLYSTICHNISAATAASA